MDRGFWVGVGYIGLTFLCLCVFFLNTGLGSVGTVAVLTSYIALWVLAGNYFENQDVRWWVTRIYVVLGLLVVVPLTWGTIPDDVRNWVKLFGGLQASRPQVIADTQRRDICDMRARRFRRQYVEINGDRVKLEGLIAVVSGRVLKPSEDPEIVALDEIATFHEACLAPLRTVVSLPKTAGQRWLAFGSLILLSLVFYGAGGKVMRGLALIIVGVVVLVAVYQMITGDWNVTGIFSGLDLKKFFPAGGLIWWWVIAGLLMSGVGLMFVPQAIVRFIGGGMIVLSILLFGQWVGTPGSPKPNPLPLAIQNDWIRVTIPPVGSKPLEFPQYKGYGIQTQGLKKGDGARILLVGRNKETGEFVDGIPKLTSRDENSVEIEVRFFR